MLLSLSGKPKSPLNKGSAPPLSKSLGWSGLSLPGPGLPGPQTVSGDLGDLPEAGAAAPRSPVTSSILDALLLRPLAWRTPRSMKTPPLSPNPKDEGGGSRRHSPDPPQLRVLAPSVGQAPAGRPGLGALLCFLSGCSGPGSPLTSQPGSVVSGSVCPRLEAPGGPSASPRPGTHGCSGLGVLCGRWCFGTASPGVSESSPAPPRGRVAMGQPRPAPDSVSPRSGSWVPGPAVPRGHGRWLEVRKQRGLAGCPWATQQVMQRGLMASDGGCGSSSEYRGGGR